MAMVKDVWFMNSGINVVGKVERKGIPRVVETKNGPTKVCGAFLKDETGEVRLTLWDSDAERIRNGYTIKIRNGYTTVFGGEKYLSSGFFGSMHIISTNPDYPKHISLKPKTRSKISTNNYNSSPSEDTSFSVMSEKDQDTPYPDLGEIAKIERQYWRESLA